MKKLRLFIISIIFLMITQISSQAAFWHKDSDLGNAIQKEEYPDSRDVEPKKESDNSLLIQGSVENTVDISLEECMKFALGNNPRIQAAMQDVFASDARIRLGQLISHSLAGKLDIPKLNSSSYLMR